MRILKLSFIFPVISLLSLSCLPVTTISYDHYKYFPEGKQGSENNLIVETPTKIKIDFKLKIIVIESSSDLIDTLLIKSSSNKLSRSKSKTNQSFLIYSKSQDVSGMIELNYKGCLVVLKDSKWYLNKSPSNQNN